MYASKWTLANPHRVSSFQVGVRADGILARHGPPDGLNFIVGYGGRNSANGNHPANAGSRNNLQSGVSHIRQEEISGKQSMRNRLFSILPGMHLFKRRKEGFETFCRQE